MRSILVRLYGLAFGAVALLLLAETVFAQFTTEVVQGYLLTAPNGNQLWVKIIQPGVSLYPGQSFPAVINVPGGLGAGESATLNLAATGFVEFHFNAEGRGTLHPSEGVEDYNGFIHQDNLKAVVEFALSRNNVIQNNLGVVTGSYGITMGAGCLGRYAFLPVKYLVDNEGPSESYVTDFEPWSLDSDSSNDRITQGYNVFHHYSIVRDSSAENQQWWSEREATRFIGNICCRYLRVQAQWDHAQPPNVQWPGFDYPPLWYPCKHGVDLLNLATLGQSPWTRANGLPLGNLPSTTYSREDPPAYYSQSMQTHPGELQLIIHEMANMPPLVLPAELMASPDGSGQGLRLRWRTITGAAAYRVYYDTVYNGGFTNYWTVATPDTSLLLETTDSRMFFKLRAVGP